MSDSRLLLLGKLGGEHRALLDQLSRDTGLRGVLQHDVEGAIGRLGEGPWAAVLVDVAAHGATRLYRKVRESPGLREVPIIALSPKVTPLQTIKALRFGADDLAPLDDPSAITRRLPTRARGLRAGEGAGPVLPPKRGPALVAEPDDARRVITARLLERAGYDVRLARDRVHLDDALRGACPRLVVLSDVLLGEAPGELRALIERAHRTSGDDVWLVTTRASSLAGLAASVHGLGRVAAVDANAPAEDMLFVVNELRGEQPQHGRQATRVAHGCFVGFRAVGAASDDSALTYNVSPRGVFVRTLLEPARSELWLELDVPRAERKVRLLGRVAWSVGFARAAALGSPAGFGVDLVEGLGSDATVWAAACEALVGGRRLPVPPLAEVTGASRLPPRPRPEGSRLPRPSIVPAPRIVVAVAPKASAERDVAPVSASELLGVEPPPLRADPRGEVVVVRGSELLRAEPPPLRADPRGEVVVVRGSELLGVEPPPLRADSRGEVVVVRGSELLRAEPPPLRADPRGAAVLVGGSDLLASTPLASPSHAQEDVTRVSGADLLPASELLPATLLPAPTLATPAATLLEPSVVVESVLPPPTPLGRIDIVSPSYTEGIDTDAPGVGLPAPPPLAARATAAGAPLVDTLPLAAALTPPGASMQAVPVPTSDLALLARANVASLRDLAIVASRAPSTAPGLGPERDSPAGPPSLPVPHDEGALGSAPTLGGAPMPPRATLGAHGPAPTGGPPRQAAVPLLTATDAGGGPESAERGAAAPAPRRDWGDGSVPTLEADLRQVSVSDAELRRAAGLDSGGGRRALLVTLAGGSAVGVLAALLTLGTHGGSGKRAEDVAPSARVSRSVAAKAVAERPAPAFAVAPASASAPPVLEPAHSGIHAAPAPGAPPVDVVLPPQGDVPQAGGAAPPVGGVATPGPSASTAPGSELPSELAALDPEHGLLFVAAAVDAEVSLHGIRAGRTNTTFETKCGPRFLRLGTPGAWKGDGVPIVVRCRALTRVELP